jgi:protein-S-isoprenylcysteine O-methyltransferase Ste14
MSARLPPAGWVLLFAGAIWALDRVSVGPLAFVLPAQGAIAGVLALIGLAVAAAGVLHFARAKTTVNPTRPDKASALVTDGVYRFTRNPMYLGMALVLLGLAVGLGSLPGLLLVPLFIVVLSYSQIMRDEAALSSRVGEAWDVYQSKVPRWLFR